MSLFVRICRIVGKLTIFIAPVALILAIVYIVVNFLLLQPLDEKSKILTVIEIPYGTSFKKTSALLEEKKIISSAWKLDLLAKIKGQASVNAGEYELSPSMTPSEILRILSGGKTFKRKVTLKEGQSVRALGAILEEAGLMKRKTFNRALFDDNLLRDLGLRAISFEGYLFPNTYHFSRPATPRSVINTMYGEFKKNWTVEYQKRAKELGFTRHKIVTLAAMIEKESGNFEEQPLISSVFHNRLENNWKLQSDPTAVYGIPGFSGPILAHHIRMDTPYNTYIIRGLPPGPICNPGASAIKAALYPAQTRYFFFVADGRGGHIFSASKKEHEHAVRIYRQIQKEKKRKKVRR